MEIVAKQLSYTYHQQTSYAKEALSKVDIQIPAGSLVAIVGQTGSGKSTLLQLLGGILTPTAGEIQVGPYSSKSHTRRPDPQFREQMGLVFQYPEQQLFAETVAKDIAFGPRNLGLSEVEQKQRVKESMNWVGLPETMADRSPFTLSRGQMRRVALAGVVAMKRSILILDEPTAGLDAEGKREILSRLDALRREQKITIVLVSHSMDEVARYAERIVILHQGTCVQSGTTESIFAQPERLKKVGLDLPEITQWIHRVNQRLQPPLPLHLFTPDQVENELMRRYQEELQRCPDSL